MLAQFLVGCLMIYLLSNVPGKTTEDGPSTWYHPWYQDIAPGFRLQLGPNFTFIARWETNQLMDILPLSLSFSFSFSFSLHSMSLSLCHLSAK